MPMSSTTRSWPSGWPAFAPTDAKIGDKQQQELKREIISKYGEPSLRQAWATTCATLEATTSKIGAQGSRAMPSVVYHDMIAPGNQAILENLKKVGCFVVRNVVTQEEASSHFDELKTFISRNSEITGWPAESPAIFHLYNSPTQLKLRTHPNQFRLQGLLNGLFSDAMCSSLAELEAQSQPILYPDAFRIREPGQEFLRLGPHIDSGSLCRWADHKYRKSHEKIFTGNPEECDPYDLTYRRDADPAMFPGGVHSSVLRTFQGWTALTSCGPGEGGIMLLPDVKYTTAYMLLRPFFSPPENGEWENAEAWVSDDAAYFPGTYRWDSQLLSPESHPHLRLKETPVSAPAVRPGETIWWHAGVCHAVETTHNGLGPASVVYIPSAPSTPGVKAYIRRYWKDLLNGTPPDDYKFLDGTGDKQVLNAQNERKMEGALPIESISTEGRQALGEGV